MLDLDRAGPACDTATAAVRDRDGHAERGAHTGELERCDAPAQQLRQFARERQPETGPVALCCRSLSSCENSSNIRSWSSGAMPMPVSATAKAIRAFLGRRAARAPRPAR